MCTQVCLAQSSCEGFVLIDTRDGTNCWLKTSDLGTQKAQWTNQSAGVSSIWNVSACKSEDAVAGVNYDTCLDTPVTPIAADGLTVLTAYRGGSASAPVAATLGDCVSSCLGDATCTGISVQATASATSQCVLFHGVVNQSDFSLWTADNVTMVYKIEDCRIAAGAVGSGTGESDSGLGANFIAAIVIAALVVCCCPIIVTALCISRRRSRRKGLQSPDGYSVVHVTKGYAVTHAATTHAAVIEREPAAVDDSAMGKAPGESAVAKDGPSVLSSSELDRSFLPPRETMATVPTRGSRR